MSSADCVAYADVLAVVMENLGSMRSWKSSTPPTHVHSWRHSCLRGSPAAPWLGLGLQCHYNSNPSEWGTGGGICVLEIADTPLNSRGG